MTTDFRALCAELLAAADEYAGMNPYMRLDNAMKTARAALAVEPEPVPKGPTNQYIEALHHAVFASRLHGPPPNTSFEVDFARAVLARWGKS
jgi:hypothetical protein